MDPYLAKPDDIPSTDSYADVPFFGRYYPQPSDFRVDPQYINSKSGEALSYWASILDLCAESTRIYPADDQGRDVFAVGSVIVKSGHLHTHAEVDYSYADANEIQAISIARGVLGDIRVPEIYFSGMINGRQVLVQERLPGVCLTVAWPYLTETQRQSFKTQARNILARLHTIKPPSDRNSRGHVVEDPNILTNGRINPLEREILFSNIDNDLSFMHNDLTDSNCIVNNDKIVGLIDWEMAGYFGWKTAGEVHRRIRTPQREHFINANLSEERLRDIMYWNDLYDQ
ncbi:kinase-like domain-containing protein [Stachybotrys elegans]|uniref:Kinase-like domain-containing protein n=1 Tax=Stachybotrys elegans TaxID=80388 RepID=A0A8K0SHH6_9HYPO|nr:kinase-like domain-containing protein [Stachybotrys elegans]